MLGQAVSEIRKRVVLIKTTSGEEQERLNLRPIELNAPVLVVLNTCDACALVLPGCTRFRVTSTVTPELGRRIVKELAPATSPLFASPSLFAAGRKPHGPFISRPIDRPPLRLPPAFFHHVMRAACYEEQGQPISLAPAGAIGARFTNTCIPDGPITVLADIFGISACMDADGEGNSVVVVSTDELLGSTAARLVGGRKINLFQLHGRARIPVATIAEFVADKQSFVALAKVYVSRLVDKLRRNTFKLTAEEHDIKYKISKTVAASIQSRREHFMANCEAPPCIKNLKNNTAHFSNPKRYQLGRIAHKYHTLVSKAPVKFVRTTSYLP